MSEVTSTGFVVLTTSSIALVPVPAVAQRCCVVQCFGVGAVRVQLVLRQGLGGCSVAAGRLGQRIPSLHNSCSFFPIHCTNGLVQEGRE
jgi:hypothetical protein